MGDHRFPHDHRIRSGADFRRIYARRCTAADRFLVVFGNPNGLEHPRLGLSVSRKVGGAVVRNRWKRLLREAFRLERARLPKGIDLVVIPRRDVEPRLSDLLRSLPRLAAQVARRLNR